MKGRKRHGIFIYCSPDIKERLKAVATLQGRTLSGYVLYHITHQLKKDEAIRR